jgi:hypothetical protein
MLVVMRITPWNAKISTKPHAAQGQRCMTKGLCSDVPRYAHLSLLAF